MRTIKEILETISEEKRDDAIKTIRGATDFESFKAAVKEYKIEASDEEQEMIYEKLMKKKKLDEADLDNVVGGTNLGGDWGPDDGHGGCL